MNWLVYHIVSGQAFFTGILLVVIGVALSAMTRPVFGRISVIALLLGMIAVIISSTPIPYWFYAIATLVTLAWIALRRVKSCGWATACATVAVWLIAAAMEIPFHIMPSVKPAHDRCLTIIGDSVTAGLGNDETAETWPAILAREQQVQVQDISHIGETAASALKRAKSREITGSVVIVEIGGNDILGSTTSTQFAVHLDALLTHLADADRQIVMFELPLPPFCHEFGRVQRQIAAKHNVILVPKRVFLSIISGHDSTLDTIHLSKSGHRLMADCVWRLVKPAFYK